MSLIQKQEMTEENLAAKRSNGSMARGAVTPEGKANSAASNLRHGLYSKAQDEAMVALGEDPQEYADLMNSLESDLAVGLESEVVRRIGRVLWRMKRAERAQDGLALQRVQGAAQVEYMVASARLAKAAEIFDRLQDLAIALNRRNGPTSTEIRTFMEAFGDNPPADMQKFFLLLQSLQKQEEGEEADEDPSTKPATPVATERERKVVRRELRARVNRMIISYQGACREFQKDCEKVHSPENLAALMAPQDEKSLLNQKMEDSNLRQLWRLTNVLFKVRNGALTQKEIKNEDRTDYVHENKGESDKMDENPSGFLVENAQTWQYLGRIRRTNVQIMPRASGGFGFRGSGSEDPESQVPSPKSRVPSPEVLQISCATSRVAVYCGFDVHDLRQLVYVL
jgi:hypothetical protein